MKGNGATDSALACNLVGPGSIPATWWVESKFKVGIGKIVMFIDPLNSLMNIFSTKLLYTLYFQFNCCNSDLKSLKPLDCTALFGQPVGYEVYLIANEQSPISLTTLRQYLLHTNIVLDKIF